MQAHQGSFSASQAEKFGHKRRPSIGKSLQVASLVLNLPPPSQSKNYSSLSRDGLSPDLDKPPIFFQLSELNDRLPRSADNDDAEDDDDGDSSIIISHDNCIDRDREEFALLVSEPARDLTDAPPSAKESEKCSSTCPVPPTQCSVVVLNESCNQLCKIDKCTINPNKDLEDIAAATMTKSYLKVPSKIDQKRKEFLKDLLNAGASDQSKELNAEEFTVKDFREKFAIAEALAKTSMMTSPAAKRRLAARKIEMELDGEYDDDNEFIPPRQLLLYLVRMGSFNSAPKINNSDSQDDSLEVPQGLSVTDLVQHCKIMRGENRPQLLTRYFLKPNGINSIISNEITDGLRVLNLNAVSKACSAPVTSSKHLRVLQWNILSQSLGQNNDGFIKCPDEALTWENRKYLIVEEILRNNPDIVCLQEVDHYKFLERVLGSQNYSGIFFPKPDSPCLYIQENNGPDGCAIFYKRDKFDLVNFDTRVLEVWRVQSNQVAIVANLRIVETGKEICVCTTHLKARNGALLSKLRNEQGKDLLRFVNAVAQERPVILSGDFNAEPIEPIYNTVLTYKSLGLSSAYADLNELENGKTIESSQIENNAEQEKSLAEMSANREPPYTTWKIREEGEVCHTIDYVFYTKKSFKVNNYLQFPQENEVGQNRTPSFQYPSDHFSLVCDLELIDDTQDLII